MALTLRRVSSENSNFFFSDPVFADFEFAYFLLGTHFNEETIKLPQNYIRISKVRLPKQVSG